MAAAIAWWVIEIQPKGEAKHADDVEVSGYEQIYRSMVGDGGIEMAFSGPRDDQIYRKIYAPGLKILSVLFTLSAAAGKRGETLHDLGTERLG